MKNLEGSYPFTTSTRVVHAAAAALELLTAWVLVRFFPFKQVVSHIGQPGQLAVAPRSEVGRAVARVAWSLQAVSRRSPVKFTCLMQAVAAQRMLRRRGIPATVYVAMVVDAPSGSPLLAHAWVRCGDRVVVGACDESRYRVIATFA